MGQHALSVLLLLLPKCVEAQEDGGSSVGLAIGISLGGVVVVVGSAMGAYVCVKRKRRRRIQHANIQEQMGKYEREQEVDRANRALQRAREVLAYRTGNADWNPELTKKNEVMQLMDVGEKNSAPVAPPPGEANFLGGVDWAAMGSVPRCVPIAAVRYAQQLTVPVGAAK